MFAKLLKKILFVVMMLSVVVMMLPQPVAAAASLGIDIVSVKADERVTIRTRDFPVDRTWTVRMDKSGNGAIDGIVVGETKSEKGGSFDVSYTIPAELKGMKTISIRLESTTGGFYTFNWFNNRDLNVSDGVPVTGSKPSIRFVGVKQNESVMVEASNFPAYTKIRVRVGPFETFFKDYVVVDSVNSGGGTSFRFTVKLPEVVKNEGMVTVRLDGENGSYAYNAFRNVDSGTVNPTPTPTPTSQVSNRCEVLSVTPNRSVSPRADFDAVWTIKNTSSTEWNLTSVDYKYISGEKLYKYAAAYDLSQTVKAGETVKIIVDMIAPEKTGVYYSNWALVSGSTTLCSLPITLTVR